MDSDGKKELPFMMDDWLQPFHPSVENQCIDAMKRISLELAMRSVEAEHIENPCRIKALKMRYFDSVEDGFWNAPE